MGIPVHRFMIDVDENLVCNVCSGVFENPSVTPCGHTFCQGCLERWLTRSPTCPSCRAKISSVNEGCPILALKSLIASLNICCEFKERGCSVVVKLDQLEGHIRSCGYAPVECAGCQMMVNRVELGSHQLGCFGIQAELNDELSFTSTQQTNQAIQVNLPLTSSCKGFSSETSCQIVSLKSQLSRSQKSSQAFEVRIRLLERDLKHLQNELAESHRLLDHSGVRNFHSSDLEDFGYTVPSVAKLTSILSHFIRLSRGTSPTSNCLSVTDVEQAFAAIKRCYDYHGRGVAADDVLSLLATSHCGIWFSDSQRRILRNWMRSLLGEDINNDH